MALMQIAIPRATDSNNAPVSGALLYVYSGGTTTPQPTYSNAALTIANAWPVVANAAGVYPPVFVAAGLYKVRMASPEGVTLYEADGVQIADNVFVSVNKTRVIEADENAMFRSAAAIDAWLARYRAGDLLAAFPGTYPQPVLPRQALTAQYLANVETVVKRFRQYLAFEWTAQSTRSGELSDTWFESGETYGVPYSSSKRAYADFGIGMTIKRAATAARLPGSVFYAELYDLISDVYPGGSPPGLGRPPIGAVCSSFIYGALGKSYSPITTTVDRDWRALGFVAKYAPNTWTSADLRKGDILNGVTVNPVTGEISGGHTEFVLDRDDSSGTITIVDQVGEGPNITIYSTVSDSGLDAATLYFRSRNYALLAYDYEGMTGVTYTPSDYAPLPDETPTPVVWNDVFGLYDGDEANFVLGQDVVFVIPAANAASLKIMRGATLIETVTLGDPPGTITRTFDTVGDYSATVVLDDASETPAVNWKVNRITQAMSASSVARGSDVTVTFTTEGCTAASLVISAFTSLSIGPGTQRDLTADEIATGRCTFTADFAARDYDVMIVGMNEYRQVLPQPIGALTLTVTE